ncbi:hypothetical protein [Aquimarina sp. AU58]|uniref:hypothetical protein n=1 Tax=Aquimarina sp. AU58 TaxID=1874112 RepID=UPI000D6E4E0B|nr:hypothetical protein [Aquimarina sp. AU58]
MKKVLIVIGMLFCVLGNAQNYSKLPAATKNDSILMWRNSDKRITHAPLSTFAGWINDAITGGATDNQQLSLSGNTLTLERGGSVDLTPILPMDQTIQTFSFNPTTNIITLQLSNDTVKTIDLSSLSGGGSGTDDQQISRSGNTITLEDGGSIDISDKQDNLVSGTNIKTINNQSLLGSGNIAISGGGGSTNANIFVPTLATDFTTPSASNANKIWEIQSTIDLAGGNFSPPANVTLSFKGGEILNVGNFVGNNTSFEFINEDLGIDLFDATLSGTFIVSEVYASNFGANDTDSNTINNFNVGKQLLYMVNQNSGTLIWNKVTDGVYHRDQYIDDYGSPFFTNGPGNDNLWLVGNGGDYVKVTSKGGAKVKSNPSALRRSSIYGFYDTKGSIIEGNHLTGDRFEHFYDKTIELTSAATSAGNVRLRIIEHPQFKDDVTEKEINELIPLTLSNIATNVTEIVNYINTDPDFADWTATNPTGNEIELRGQPGQYSTVIFTDETSGAGVSVDITDLYEWGHGVVYGSNAIDCIVRNNVIEQFHGDGIARRDQTNGNFNITDDHLTNGFIDENGTITAGGSYQYMTLTRDMPTPHLWFTFFPGASTSVYLTHFRYWMIFYDENDVFIEKSSTLTPYTVYEYPDNYKKYRILVDDNGTNITDFRWFVTSPSYPFRAIIENNVLRENRRHGITNPAIGAKILYNNFYKNTGVLPSGDLNIEDYGKKSNNYIIEGNRFSESNFFNLSIKGPDRVIINNNWFEGGIQDFNGSYNSKTVAILTSFCRKAKITNNFFVDKSSNVDLSTDFRGNTLTNSQIDVRSGGAVVTDNIFINSRIRSGAPGGVITEGLMSGHSYVTNNTFYISKGWGNASFIDEDNTLRRDNNKFLFNHKATQHAPLNEETLRTVELQGTSENYMRSQRTIPQGEPYTGSTRREIVEGIQAIASQRHYVGWTMYAAPISDINIGTSLKIESGYPKSFIIDGGKVEGWLWLDLEQYATDGVGDFETITVKDLIIDVPANISANEGFLNNSNFGGTQLQNLVRVTQDKNVNLAFENCTFKTEDTTTGLFLYLGHRGTTILDNCTFSSPSPQTIDFTTGGAAKTIGVYRGPNTGNITNINPTTNNISFVYRGSDTGLISYGGNATDVNAIHSNVSNEVNSLTEKVTPIGADVLVIEDSADSNNKKKIQIANLPSSGGATNLTYSNGVIQSDTGTDATIPSATNSVNGLATSAQVTKLEGIETGATADQTGAEIESALDTQLGNTDWKVAGASFDGGTIAQNLTLDDGVGSPPQIRLNGLSGADNIRGSLFITNDVMTLQLANLTTPFTTGLVFSNTAIRATGNTFSLGTSSTRFVNGWFSGDITAANFKVEGGTSSQFLKANGSVDNTAYATIPTITNYSASQNFFTSDINNSRNYTGAASNTWLLSTTVDTAANIGDTVWLSSSSASGTVAINPDTGITILDSGNGLTLGPTRRSGKITKVAANTWIMAFFD